MKRFQPVYITASIFYTDNQWSRLILDAVLPFYNAPNHSRPFVIGLNYFRGDAINIITKVEKKFTESFLIEFDHHFSRFLCLNPSTSQNTVYPSDNLFANFSNNSIRYNLFEFDTQARHGKKNTSDVLFHHMGFMFKMMQDLIMKKDLSLTQLPSRINLAVNYLQTLRNKDEHLDKMIFQYLTLLHKNNASVLAEEVDAALRIVEEAMNQNLINNPLGSAALSTTSLDGYSIIENFSMVEIHDNVPALISAVFSQLALFDKPSVISALCKYFTGLEFDVKHSLQNVSKSTLL